MSKESALRMAAIRRTNKSIHEHVCELQKDGEKMNLYGYTAATKKNPQSNKPREYGRVEADTRLGAEEAVRAAYPGARWITIIGPTRIRHKQRQGAVLAKAEGSE